MLIIAQASSRFYKIHNAVCMPFLLVSGGHLIDKAHQHCTVFTLSNPLERKVSYRALSTFFHCRQVKMVFKETIVASFSLILLKYFLTDGFETNKCDHRTLTMSLRKVQACITAVDESDNDDFCSEFPHTRECVTSNLPECFSEEHVEKMAKECLGFLRQGLTKLLLNTDIQKVLGFVLAEAELDFLFDACPSVPDKSFAEKVGQKYFYALETGVRTDKNCTENEMKNINVVSAECWLSEVEKALTQLSRRLGYAGGSYQTTACSVLNETVGKCMRAPLPACISERERMFLKTTMLEDFKSIVDIFESEFGQISLSDCYLFSASKLNYPTSSVVYLMLSLINLAFSFLLLTL
jgi:hypothetical protein